MSLSSPPGRSRVLWALLLSAALLSATVFGLDRSSSSAQPASSTVASTDTTAGGATSTTAGEGADPNGNVNDLPVHDGTQKGNVFNPVPFGEIPQTTPEIVILRPGSGRILPVGRETQIRARFQNFQPGFFSDPATQYGVSPQRLNDQGNLQGHNHACIDLLPTQGAPDDRCESFVVLEQEGTTDVVSNLAPPITQPGRYRICVDVASETHYVGVRAFAQRVGPVDCVRVLFVRARP
jgi:hypothetical protein